MGFSDFQLGNKFWLNANAGDFAKQVDDAIRSEVGDIPSATVSKKTLDALKRLKELKSTQFFTQEGKSFLKSASGRAEIFAASHFLDDQPLEINQERARINAEALGVNRDDFKKLLAFFQETTRTKGGKIGDMEVPPGLEDYLEDALDMVLASEEFTQRAQENTPLSEAGKLALMNSVLGVAVLLQKGKISREAMLVMLDSKAFDLSKTSDMLQMACDCARKVKDIFADGKGVDKALAECERQLAILKSKPDADEEKIRKLALKIEDLRNRGRHLVTNRQLACCIPDDIPLVDPTGEMDTEKYQEMKLKEMKNSLRMFRYDLDIATDKKMGHRERFRRFLDDLRSSSSGFETRMTPEQFSVLKDETTTFNNELKDILTSLNQLTGEESQTNDFTLDFNQTITTATKLSHATNDRIRNFQEFDSAEKKTADKIQKSLGKIAQFGGMRKARLEVGLDFMIGLDPKFATLKVNAGTKFILDAEISVPEGGGPVTVTIAKQGDVHAGAKASAGLLPGMSAGAQAEANAGLGRTTCVTFASLDDFIHSIQGREVSIDTLATQTSFGSILLSKLSQVARASTRRFKLGLAELQLLRDREIGDCIHFTEEMEKLEIFTGADLIRQNRRMALKSSSTVFVSAFGGAEADVGVSLNTQPAGKSGVGMAAHAGLGTNVSTNFNVRHTAYSHFSETLKDLPLHQVESFFREEKAELMRQPFVRQHIQTIDQILADTRTPEAIAKNFETLFHAFKAAEKEANGHDPADNTFWETYARLSRLLLATCEILTKKAQAMPLGTPQQRQQLLSLAKRAEKFLRSVIVNSPVKIPTEIVEKYLMKSHGFYDRSRMFISGKCEIGVEIHPPHPEIPTEEDPTSIAKNVGKKVLNTTFEKGLDAAKDLFVAKRTGVGMSFEISKPIGDKKSSVPWNDHTLLTLDVTLTAGLPLRTLVDIIAEAATQRLLAGIEEPLGETTKEKKDRLLAEIKNQLISSILGIVTADLKTVVTDENVVEIGKKFMVATVCELAAKSPTFAKLLGSAITSQGTATAGKNDATPTADMPNIAPPDASTKKTISLHFSDTRFVGFTLANESKSDGMHDIPIHGPLNLHIGFGTTCRRVDFSILARPDIDTALRCMNHFKKKDQATARKKFMTRNQNGMLRLLQGVKRGNDLQLEEDDEKFAEDRTQLRERMDQVTNLLQDVIHAHPEDECAAKAQKLLQTFDEIVNDIKHMPDDMPDLKKLKLAEKFLLTMVSAFDLATITLDG